MEKAKSVVETDRPSCINPKTSSLRKQHWANISRPKVKGVAGKYVSNLVFVSFFFFVASSKGWPTDENYGA